MAAATIRQAARCWGRLQLRWAGWAVPPSRAGGERQLSSARTSLGLQIEGTCAPPSPPPGYLQLPRRTTLTRTSE